MKKGAGEGEAARLGLAGLAAARGISGVKVPVGLSGGSVCVGISGTWVARGGSVDRGIGFGVHEDRNRTHANRNGFSGFISYCSFCNYSALRRFCRALI